MGGDRRAEASLELPQLLMEPEVFDLGGEPSRVADLGPGEGDSGLTGASVEENDPTAPVGQNL